MQASIASRLLRSAAAAAAAAGSRSASSASGNAAASTVYNVVFKRNITYATYIFGVALVGQAIYTGALENVWNGINKGRTYDSVDWSKFKVEDE